MGDVIATFNSTPWARSRGLEPRGNAVAHQFCLRSAGQNMFGYVSVTFAACRKGAPSSRYLRIHYDEVNQKAEAQKIIQEVAGS